MEAGDIIIYDLYLLPCEAGVFIKDNLVLLAVLREEDGVSLAGADGWSTDDVHVWQSYHFNWPECNNSVATPAVGPGIPARILPLLKHVLLPLTVGLLVSHPSEEQDAHFCHKFTQHITHKDPSPSLLSVSDPHSRSTQHQYGAHFLHACFLEVVTEGSQLLAASLEVFLFIDNQLWGERG